MHRGLGQQETFGCAAMHSPAVVLVPPLGGSYNCTAARSRQQKERGPGHCCSIMLGSGTYEVQAVFPRTRPSFVSAFRLPRAGQQLAVLYLYMDRRRDTGPGPGEGAGRGIRRPACNRCTALHTSSFISLALLWCVADLPFLGVSKYALRLDANSSSPTSLAACLGPSGGSVKMRPGRNRVSYSVCPRPITQDKLLAPVVAASYQSSSPLHSIATLCHFNFCNFLVATGHGAVGQIALTLFRVSRFLIVISFFFYLLLQPSSSCPAICPRTLRQRLARVDCDRSAVAWQAVSGLRTQNGLCSRQTDLT